MIEGEKQTQFETQVNGLEEIVGGDLINLTVILLLPIVFSDIFCFASSIFFEAVGLVLSFFKTAV